jgi:hypothetical protein
MVHSLGKGPSLPLSASHIGRSGYAHQHVTIHANSHHRLRAHRRGGFRLSKQRQRQQLGHKHVRLGQAETAGLPGEPHAEFAAGSQHHLLADAPDQHGLLPVGLDRDHPRRPDLRRSRLLPGSQRLSDFRPDGEQLRSLVRADHPRCPALWFHGRIGNVRSRHDVEQSGRLYGSRSR